MIFGVSLGGGKYSFSWVRRVELNFLDGVIVCERTETHCRHSRDAGTLEPLTSNRDNSVMLMAVFPLMMDAAVGRAEAYMADENVSNRQELILGV